MKLVQWVLAGDAGAAAEGCAAPLDSDEAGTHLDVRPSGRWWWWWKVESLRSCSRVLVTGEDPDVIEADSLDDRPQCRRWEEETAETASS